MENSLKVSLYTSQAEAAAEQYPRWSKGSFHTSLGYYVLIPWFNQKCEPQDLINPQHNFH
jgi:hypothetical protein